MELKGNLRQLQQNYLEELRKVTEGKLTRGALVEAVGSTEDGFVFTDGRTQKPKKFIIIGIDEHKQECYGVVVVNSKMNPRAGYSHEYLASQFELHQEDYPDFLKYNSYADCSVIMNLPLGRLLTGEYFETLKDDDMNGIMSLLETSDILTAKQKKRYNVKRR